MQTATSYIPAAIFLAIAFLLVWVGFSRANRIRAKAAAQMDAYLKAINRNTEATERIAAALEARNKTRSLGTDGRQTGIPQPSD
jgi:Flp pilus assembly protein TadB